MKEATRFHRHSLHKPAGLGSRKELEKEGREGGERGGGGGRTRRRNGTDRLHRDEDENVAQRNVGVM